MINLETSVAEPANILLVSPHPDDEIIGAGATAIALRTAGHRIVNLACCLGTTATAPRRTAELQEACNRADFELILPEDPAYMHGDGRLAEAEEALRSHIQDVYKELQPKAVIAPSVHDSHHDHEAVARATRDALAPFESARLWMYNVWGELPLPTIYNPFDQAELDHVQYALAAHGGETARNDYHNLVLGRALVGKVLGSEKIFGFGAAAVSQLPYAELLTEVIRGPSNDMQWVGGRTRMLTANALFEDAPTPHIPRDFWLMSPSVRQEDNKLREIRSHG